MSSKFIALAVVAVLALMCIPVLAEESEGSDTDRPLLAGHAIRIYYYLSDTDPEYVSSTIVYAPDYTIIWCPPVDGVKGWDLYGTYYEGRSLEGVSVAEWSGYDRINIYAVFDTETGTTPGHYEPILWLLAVIAVVAMIAYMLYVNCGRKP